MERLTLETLKELTQHEQSPKISGYMPTIRAGREVVQNPTRFKNMLSEAERQLIAREMPASDIEAMLKPGHDLLDDAAFWQFQSDGLAVFIAPDEFHTYRLPFSVEEQLVISQHYVLTPVMELFNNNGRYFVLAISQNQVRLFEGTRYNIQPVELLESTPESLDDTLPEAVPEKELQMHSDVGQGVSGGIFHGSGEDNSKERILRYLNLLDAALKPLLREERAPLVLAAVDYLQPIYHDQSEYANVMKQGINGNPEHLRPEELQELAWPIVAPVFQEATETAKRAYGDLSATERATHDLRDIVAAAVYGRVDTLFTAKNVQEWGTFDADTSKVVVRRDGPRSYEDLSLIDYAAMNTLLNGGSVYVLDQEEMPADQPVVAVLRY